MQVVRDHCGEIIQTSSRNERGTTQHPFFVNVCIACIVAHFSATSNKLLTILYKTLAHMSFVIILQIVSSDADSLPTGSASADAPKPVPVSRGQRQLQAHLNNSAASAGEPAKGGKMRPLYEVRQSALQDSNAAHRVQMATDRARLNSAEKSGIDMKSGLKRNLHTMQHALVSAGDAENRVGPAGAVSGSSTCGAAYANASIAAQVAAEAVAKEKREAYEAWRDSMKKAKLSR